MDEVCRVKLAERRDEDGITEIFAFKRHDGRWSVQNVITEFADEDYADLREAMENVIPNLDEEAVKYSLIGRLKDKRGGIVDVYVTEFHELWGVELRFEDVESEEFGMFKSLEKAREAVESRLGRSLNDYQRMDIAV